MIMLIEIIKFFSNKMDNHVILDRTTTEFQNELSNLQQLFEARDIDPIEDFYNKFLLEVGKDKREKFIMDNKDIIYQYYCSQRGFYPLNGEKDTIRNEFARIFIDIFKRKNYSLFKENISMQLPTQTINKIINITDISEKLKSAKKFNTDIKITYDDNILRINSLNLNIDYVYNLSEDLQSFSGIIGENHKQIVLALFMNHFDILYSFLELGSEYVISFFNKFIDIVILILRKQINNGNFSDNDLNIFKTNIDTLRSKFFQTFHDNVTLPYIIKISDDFINMQNGRKVIETEKLKSNSDEYTLAENSMKNAYTESDTLFPEHVSLSRITKNDLVSLGYIKDIGETPYIVEDLNKYTQENAKLRVNTLFSTIQYLFGLNGMRYNELNNANLNNMFYNLFTNDILSTIQNLIKNEDQIFRDYINTFVSNSKNNDAILANKLMGLLGQNMTLSEFLNPLFNWYLLAQYPIVSSSELAKRTSGFIFEQSDAKKECVSVIIDDKEVPALLTGKINYAKQIFNFFKLTEYANKTSKHELIIKEGLPSYPRKENFEFDYWQKEALRLADEGNSIIISGSTSGGKTALSNALIEKFLISNRNDKILFVLPTVPLAQQVYCNLLKTFSETRNPPEISIYTETLDIITPKFNILIGTPQSLVNILTMNDPDNLGKMYTFDKIIMDEAHTISSNYNKTDEGQQLASCTHRLYDCIHNNTQVILLSATLNERSMNELANIVQSKSQRSVDFITYTSEDIGKKYKDQVLSTPVILPQEKYIITQNPEILSFNSIIKSQVNNQVDVTGQFIFKLLKSINRWRTVPCAVFSGDEVETYDLYSKLINYIETGSSKCELWLNLRSSFLKSVENRSDKVTYFKDSFDLVYSEFKKSLLVKFDKSECIEFANCDIMRKFNEVIERENKQKYTEDVLPYITPEMYGLMFEIINLSSYILEGGNKKPFSGNHPYYRFNNTYVRDTLFDTQIDGKETNFGQILRISGINYNEENSFVNLMLKGIKYGVALVTSTVPLAFQLEIFVYLKQSSTSDAPLPFIFCDDKMSMGINYSFMSTVILKSQMEDISTSKYLQIKGRAGRRSYGVLTKPEVYLVNISNADKLNDIENIIIPENIPQFYFENPIEQCVNLLALKIGDRLPKNIKEYDILVKNFKFTDNNSKKQIRSIKLQIMELYDRFISIYPSISDTFLRDLYEYIQNVEYSKIQEA